MISYGPPHVAEQKQDGPLEHTYSSYVRIRDVALNTCQKRWTIGRSDERGSGISVLAARHETDDDVIHIYILDCVLANFRFLKASCNYVFQTSNVLNAIGNDLIKECLHRSFSFQEWKIVHHNFSNDLKSLK